jgi:pimeloyl-ACP methyl ester carboxylesterase
MRRVGLIVLVGIGVLGVVVVLTVPAINARLRPAEPVEASPAAGWTDVTIRPESGGSFTATVFYPAVAPGGADAPLDMSGTPYPAVVFGHGYLANPGMYAVTLGRLAMDGFVVIAPRTRRTLLPDHSQFADDMRASLTWLVGESERKDSLFSGAIRPDAFGAAGHSMGGGAALLAASRDPRIAAVSTFAAADTRPSSLDVVGRIQGAVQFIAGSDDAIAPLEEHQRPLFDNVTAAKQLVVLKGGTHCGFLDEEPPLCDRGSMNPDEQLALSRQLLSDWFRQHLSGAEASRDHISSPSPDPRMTITTKPARQE